MWIVITICPTAWLSSIERWGNFAGFPSGICGGGLSQYIILDNQGLCRYRFEVSSLTQASILDPISQPQVRDHLPTGSCSPSKRPQWAGASDLYLAYPWWTGRAGPYLASDPLWCGCLFFGSHAGKHVRNEHPGLIFFLDSDSYDFPAPSFCSVAGTLDFWYRVCRRAMRDSPLNQSVSPESCNRDRLQSKKKLWRNSFAAAGLPACVLNCHETGWLHRVFLFFF